MSSPDPSRIVDVLCAYWQTAALIAAIDLGVFTALGGRARSASELAGACRADRASLERLCDFLVSLGLLRSANGRYQGRCRCGALSRCAVARVAGSDPGFLHRPSRVHGPGGSVGHGAGTKGRGVTAACGRLSRRRRWRCVAARRRRSRRCWSGAGSAAAASSMSARAHHHSGSSCCGVGADATLVARDRASVLRTARQHAKAAGVSGRVAAGRRGCVESGLAVDHSTWS